MSCPERTYCLPEVGDAYIALAIEEHCHTTHASCEPASHVGLLCAPFSSLRSRCTTCMLWRYLTPSMIWHTTLFRPTIFKTPWHVGEPGTWLKMRRASGSGIPMQLACVAFREGLGQNVGPNRTFPPLWRRTAVRKHSFDRWCGSLMQGAPREELQHHMHKLGSLHRLWTRLG